jgi:4-carboxymuconolactone decarboxylase
MRTENTKALDEFLVHADAISDDILADTQEMLGNIPFILPLMRERPEYFALNALSEEMVCRPKHLPARTAELVALAAAASAGSEPCMQVHIRAAVKEGASREEIYDTIMIAALIGKTRVLGPAFRIMAGELDKDAGKQKAPR